MKQHKSHVCGHPYTSSGYTCSNPVVSDDRCWRHGGRVNKHSAKRKRCGVKKRSSGEPCQRWGMKNGRCHLHGGLCRGPTTLEGMARSLANLKRGKSGKFGQKLRKLRHDLHNNVDA